MSFLVRSGTAANLAFSTSLSVVRFAKRVGSSVVGFTKQAGLLASLDIIGDRETGTIIGGAGWQKVKSSSPGNSPLRGKSRFSSLSLLQPGRTKRKSSILLSHAAMSTGGVFVSLPYCCSINTLDDESSATTGFISPWKPK